MSQYTMPVKVVYRANPFEGRFKHGGITSDADDI
jgi:hypothetical protein